MIDEKYQFNQCIDWVKIDLLEVCNGNLFNWAVNQTLHFLMLIIKKVLESQSNKT